MSTWGQKRIKVDKYDTSPTLYYNYQTSTDTYMFIERGINDYSYAEDPSYCSDYIFSADVGEAMMEAYVAHIMAFDGYSKEEFIERFIENNRFRNAEKVENPLE